MLVRLFRIITGFVFLLLCVSMFMTLLYLLDSLRNAWNGGISGPALWFAAGFVVWLVCFMFLPRPVIAYVFAHELTHAIWAFFSDKHVKKISISRKGGSVSLSEANFLITLSPYFFPFYTVLVVLLYYVVWAFVDPAPFENLWLGLIGATWCFHITFTLSALTSEQPDIKTYGYIFSYGLVFLLNITVVCIGLVAVSSATLEMFAQRSGHDVVRVWMFLSELCVSFYNVFLQYFTDIAVI